MMVAERVLVMERALHAEYDSLGSALVPLPGELIPEGFIKLSLAESIMRRMADLESASVQESWGSGEENGKNIGITMTNSDLLATSRSSSTQTLFSHIILPVQTTRERAKMT